MRKLLMATAAGLSMGIASLAMAASPNETSPELRAYVNLDFGGKTSNFSRSFHYGLRLDQDSRVAARLGRLTPLPSIMQVDFTGHSGFDSARINGVPFANHVAQLNEDGSEGSGYNAWDWGLLAVGVVGLGFGIAEVVKTHDSPDPKTTQQTVTTTDANGNPVTVVVTTVNGVITSVTNVLTGAGIPVNQLPTVLPTLCSTTHLCMSGNSYERALSAATAERDIQRLDWLETENGHMGDLYPAH
ncbi:MAG: hypothetical protein E6R07_04920 [Nevskiaceae bacterium]|nr:MAG: hypothetical protein E6R07_04920 [Nevskiaceae bacterium]